MKLNIIKSSFNTGTEVFVTGTKDYEVDCGSQRSAYFIKVGRRHLNKSESRGQRRPGSRGLNAALKPGI